MTPRYTQEIFPCDDRVDGGTHLDPDAPRKDDIESIFAFLVEGDKRAGNNLVQLGAVCDLCPKEYKRTRLEF